MKTGHLEGQEGQGREASRASLRPHSRGLQHRLLEALGRCHLRKSRQDCRVTIPALPCGAEIYNAERLRGQSTVPSSRACMYRGRETSRGPGDICFACLARSLGDRACVLRPRRDSRCLRTTAVWLCRSRLTVSPANPSHPDESYEDLMTAACVHCFIESLLSAGHLANRLL